MAVTTFAAIDVGSYDLQLTIYEISAKKKIVCLDHVRKTVGAGSDTYADGKVSYKHTDAICGILKGFTQIMDEFQVKEYRALGTSALREAANSQLVLDQIKVRTGIDVRVLSNSEQRFLGYKAIALKENEFQTIIKKGTAIVDVGSGGTQLSLFDKDALVTTQYLQFGAVRIRQILDHLDGERPYSWELVQELVDSDMESFRKMFLKDREIKNIVATGLCVQYLNRSAERQNPQQMTAQEFLDFFERIAGKSPEQLALDMDIPVEHAYLMHPTAMIYRKMIEVTGAELLWIPGVNLCDGIVAEYAEQKQVIRFSHDFTQDILAAARNISKRYLGNKKHNQSLEKIALSIFDAMKKYHGLGKRERLLLELSAIMNDCGKYISLREPAESSYHIVSATEIIGISHDERKMVADIVKYSAVKYEYDKIMAQGSRETNITIAKLVAIMRVGIAMDRSHKQKFENIRLSLKERKLTLTTDTEADISLEQSLFEKQADFFEEVYGVRPVLKRRKGV